MRIKDMTDKQKDKAARKSFPSKYIMKIADKIKLKHKKMILENADLYTQKELDENLKNV